MKRPTRCHLLPLEDRRDMAEWLNRAIRDVGSTTELARRLKISQQAVSRWEVCPPHQARALERLTQGRITRYRLRPDIFGASADD